ncbi:MAG TPA: hypothetical protein VNO23_00380 [Candidatus Binatia bacterium]|nr:hypothetical protein [Candidatus Binatia bacterium]
MAIVIRSLPPLVTAEGTVYRPRICGRRRPDDGLWEGWIEFEPAGGGLPVLRTPRETTQPKLSDLQYWAGGLTAVYLEGALERAIEAALDELEAETGGADRLSERPTYDAPAPSPATRAPSASRAPSEPMVGPEDAVLDPFRIYREGETLLRERLAALSAAQLRAIVRANALAGPDELDPEALDPRELAELIVRSVRARLAA